MKLGVRFDVVTLDDEYIGVPVGDGSTDFHGVLKLNEEGAEIVKLLADDTSEVQIVEELMKDYSTPKELLLTRVRCFIEQLRCNGLINE